MDVSKYLGDREPVAYIIEGEAKVWIKPISPRRFEQVSDKHTITKLKGSRFVPKIDERAVALQLLDETIVRWEHIESEDGPIECNAKNKVELYDLWGMFRRVWSEAVFSEFGGDRDIEALVEGN